MTMILKFEDSNLSGIGSDMDASLRKSAAESEEQFTDIGTKAGLEIWRIEKFEPVKLATSQHGQFYSGDAYIVLETYKPCDDSDVLAWNLYFWLGKDCTQDEKGAAAYFTVNVDDLLCGKPVQIRETQDYETKEFLGLFKVFNTMDGGCASGFKKVEKEVYKERLFHVFGSFGTLRVKQVKMDVVSLNNTDCFILDAGLKVYQWNSQGSGPFERRRASEVVVRISEERDGEVEDMVIDGDDINDVPQFWEALGGKGEIVDGDEIRDEDEDENGEIECKLYQVSDESGEMVVKLEASGETLDRGLVNPDDVHVVIKRTGSTTVAFFYAGSKCSRAERFWMTAFSDKILEQCEVPTFTTTTTVTPKNENPAFEACFA